MGYVKVSMYVTTAWFYNIFLLPQVVAEPQIYLKVWFGVFYYVNMDIGKGEGERKCPDGLIVA